ncbi:MAG: polysaccharide deacetylase family protein [Gemmatimonadaceae bacterium]
MPSDGRSSHFGSIAFHLSISVAAFAAGLAVAGVLRPVMVLAALLPFVATVAVGVALPISGVFTRVVHRATSGRAEIALTFDDGPDARWTPPLLDLLDAHEQRATFFIIGGRAELHPQIVQDIARRGHEIANHTWDHSYNTAFMSPRALASELTRTNTLLEQLTGKRPRWFRPPVGLLSPRVVAGADQAKIEIVCWTATARDGTRRTSVNEAYQRLEHALKPGAILVLHDARVNDEQFDKGDEPPVALRVVSRLLDRMETEGLRSVTLSELCAPR